MKKCDFCAEEIQSDAIKCRFCGEFLKAAQTKLPWYYTTQSIIMGFLVVGPFILPLVWRHPTYRRTTKWIITLLTIIITYYLTASTLSALRSIKQYYQGMF